MTMAEKKFYRCYVCNDIHYGLFRPLTCPSCNTEKGYVELTGSEAEKIMRIKNG